MNQYEMPVTVRAAAQQLGLSEWTLYRWKEAGLIAYYPIGDSDRRRQGEKKQERFKIKISDVIRFLESRRVPANWERVI